MAQKKKTQHKNTIKTCSSSGIVNLFFSTVNSIIYYSNYHVSSSVLKEHFHKTIMYVHGHITIVTKQPWRYKQNPLSK